VKDKYKYLNSALESPAFLASNATNPNDLDTNCLKPTENCPFEMKYLNREKGENSISSRSKHFHNLRIIYSKLHDVASLINSTYGITLLCATLWVFIGIISCVNYIIKVKPIGNHLYVTVAVLWSTFCVALMIIMAVSCSLAVNECNRSPVIVQKILLRDDIDREAMKELKKMFSQFKVMKIEFSTCGMYRIDLRFLCGIFGATLSYLIISLQL
jgi:cytochrome bd-type quinol oxidase subunit 1